MRQTIETISAMNPDALIVRHKSSGAPKLISQWTNSAVINAGDGAHEHPTQALLDCMTLLQELNRTDLAGLRIAFVGDFDHSRVAASSVRAFKLLDADITIVGPPTLTTRASAWPVEVSHDLDNVVSKADVVYTIRPQAERMEAGLLPSMRDYTRRYSLTSARFAQMNSNALVMEAGPLVPGIQMSADVATDPRCLINKQVANGVPIRMAVLSLLLGGTQ